MQLYLLDTSVFLHQFDVRSRLLLWQRAPQCALQACPGRDPFVLVLATALVPEEVARVEIERARGELRTAQQHGYPPWWLFLKSVTAAIYIVAAGVRHALGMSSRP